MARWTEGARKVGFQHCSLSQSGLGVKETHNTKVLWEKLETLFVWWSTNQQDYEASPMPMDVCVCVWV